MRLRVLVPTHYHPISTPLGVSIVRQLLDKDQFVKITRSDKLVVIGLGALEQLVTSYRAIYVSENLERDTNPTRT